MTGQGWEDLGIIFSLWRVDRASGGQVVTGRLRPELEPESPQVEEFLGGWRGSHSRRRGAFGWELLLFLPTDRRERWWLHALLFVFTLLSTTTAGSLLVGATPLDFFLLPGWGGLLLPIPVHVDLAALSDGLPFGVSLVAVLALHEAGHYVLARRHGISVTPPFFIPFPPYVSIIGTLGAFIRLRSPVMSRNALLDVGVSGPLLSFVASLPLIAWGFLHSQIINSDAMTPSSFLVPFMGDRFWVGSSLVFSGLARAILGFDGVGQVLALHPVAFAGWLGLFVTALNLLPLSQLDGGHIVYAALGARQRLLAWVFFLGLLPLGFVWAGWWVWALLVFVVGRGRIRHPSIFNDEQGLTPGRQVTAVVAFVLFALCFVPIPFKL